LPYNADMKIAVQLTLLPGKDATDKAKWAKDHGVDGIELVVWGGGGLARMQREADDILPALPVSSICGNLDSDEERSFDFLHPDPAKRRKCIDGCKSILALCGQVGAAGQIVPPIFGPPLVPDLSPSFSPLDLEDQLMLAACAEIGPHAAAHRTLFMLEPLNRYEQHYLRQQSDGVRIIKMARQRGVRHGLGLLSDLFHMHIEETDSPAALRAAGPYVSHLHLPDNTRLEPGTADLDFVAAFSALKDIGFSGFMAYECGISGKSEKDKAANLAKSIRFVRECMAQARKSR
jgi:sugar phosphate isomerase/epimerase